jgi:hypothetical protein
MGSKYLVDGQETQGLRFDIGNANPPSILERMVNIHLSTIVKFLKTKSPFKDDLAYRKLCKLNSIGFIAYYLTDMGNVLFLNIARYNSKMCDYVVYLPHQLDKEQKDYIVSIVSENFSSKYTILHNLKLDENSIPVGDTKSDISADEFLSMI